MNETKPATRSLTIQSVVVTLLVVLYQTVAKYFMPDLPDIPDGILEFLVGAGLLTAGVGRARADKKIGSGN